MKNSKRKIRWGIALLAISLLLAALVYAGRGMLTDKPFASHYAFDGPSGVFPGESGRLYVIDMAKKNVLVIDETGALLRVLTGGKDSDSGFFYASLVAEGADGSVYVADVRYAGRGTIIGQERIFRYGAEGGAPELVYRMEYADESAAPMQYGNILSMAEHEGSLVFTVKTQAGLEVRTLGTSALSLRSGEVSTVCYDLPGQHISDADVDMATMRPCFVNRFGQICRVEEDGSTTVLLDDASKAWRLLVDGDTVYYTDLAENAVFALDAQTGEKALAIQGEDILYTAEKAAGALYSTDYAGYYRLQNGETEYVAGVPYAKPGLRIALWACVFAAGALAAAGLLLLLANGRIKGRRSPTFERSMIVISVSLCIGVLVGYITLNSMLATQTRSTMEQLNLFNDILVEASDMEALARIDGQEDYENADYHAVKSKLDSLVDMTYENGLCYYYVLYKADGETIYVIMDYEQTTMAWHPLYTWGVEGYTDVFVTGEAVEFGGDVSSYGAWAFVLKPMFDESGDVVAMMEVGANLDALQAQSNALIKSIVLTVAAVAVVLLMFILEAIFFADHRERLRLGGADLPRSFRYPLRTMAFLMFLADCMQDPFISILANQLYTPILGIPQSVGAALPLSAQVFMAAISALACGSLIRKTGVKRMLIGGFTVQLLGFAACGTFMSYGGILIGKAVIGMGIGALLVSLNSVAASGTEESVTASSFTAVNAGTLAGVTVGAGVGSLVLSFAEYSTVYYAGALLLLLGLALALLCPGAKEGVAWDEAAQKTPRGGALRFFADRSVWTFLLLMLLPFLVAISYREYFFPLYAAEMGVSEADIGRIYLVCGLVVIYLGPVLTKAFIGRIGGKGTVMLATALIAGASLLFAFVPTLGAAVAGVLLLSVATSFGYAAQSTYYASLPGVSRYGESKAMGVYSLFDNSGQTLGPVLYGVALLFGYRTGVLIMGCAVAAMLLLFFVANLRKKRPDVNEGLRGQGKEPHDDVEI